MGSVDILVNNAGITRDNIFMRMKDEEWDQVIEVNLSSGFRLCRAAIKGMMKRRSGRIIGITSVVGVTGNPGQVNYAAAKAGMIGMYKSLAREVASRSITVNTIAPGFIETAMTDALNDKQKESILTSVPAGRLGTSAEIASAALLSCQRRSCLRDGSDPSRQWRHGYDLKGSFAEQAKKIRAAQQRSGPAGKGQQSVLPTRRSLRIAPISGIPV